MRWFTESPASYLEPTKARKFIATSITNSQKGPVFHILLDSGRNHSSYNHVVVDVPLYCFIILRNVSI